MKVLICDKTEKEYIEQMRAAGLTVDVRDDITPEELMTVLPDYDGMVVRSRTKVRQPLIDVCPNLKVIVRGGAGLDTIDHEYAKSKGIAVMNTPLANSASVAELAIGYMLMMARSLYQATASMKAEKWDKKSFNGDEIGGKTLGLIGVGNIGKEVAKRASVMGMTVVAYDPYVKEIDGHQTGHARRIARPSRLHQPAPAQDQRIRGHDRQGTIRQDEERCPHRQLRARRHRRRERALRSAHQRQGRWRGVGCLQRGTPHRLETAQAG